MLRRIVPILFSATIVLCLAHAGECAKPKPKTKTSTPRAVHLSFFELTPLNVDERSNRSDLEFKAELEKIMKITLKGEGIIVDTVDRVEQGYIQDEGRYAREMESDFILKGTFMNFYDKQLVVTIQLLRTRDGVREVLSAPVARVPKENAYEVLVPWFKYLSFRIANLVRDRPPRQAVLTYCFDVDQSDSELRELAQYLALELPGELESGLGSSYQVLGFQKRAEVIQCCNGTKDLGSYLDLYDFVISGDVSSRHRGHVTIGIKIRTGGKSKLRENLTRKNDSTQLVSELGKFIITRWPAVTAK